MAFTRSTGEIFVNLGLNIDDLETGFIAAENTVRQNLARLNREDNLIRLRAQVEIGNLDETADAVQILTVREDALNQRIAIQRDRIRLTEASMRSLIDTHGEASTIAQRAAASLERERLALQRLERELNELHETQEAAGNSGENFANGLNLAQRALIALAAASTAAILSGRELIEQFHELQNAAYEWNMPIDKTRDFLNLLKLGGGDADDFEGYIRGISDALVKGEWDDPEFIALSKYGAKIIDETGRLKNAAEITEEIHKAFKKANAAGEGIEFLQLTGGEAGVRDAIQFLNRYEEAKEDRARILKADIDERELHKLDREFGVLTVQAQEFKNEIANLITPTMLSAVEKFFELFRDGTEYLIENKDEFQRWFFIAEETWNTITEKAGNVSDKIKKFGETKLNIGVENPEFQGLQEVFKEAEKTPLDQIKSFLFDDIVKRAEEKQAIYNDLKKQREIQAEEEEFQKEIDALEKMYDSPLSQYATKRVQKFKDELDDLNIEIDFKDDDYSRAIAETELWLQRELQDKIYVSKEEEAAIYKLYATKQEQIEQEKNDRIAEIRESVNAEFQNDLQNRIAKIEEEKNAWISAGMEEAEASQLAERLKTDAIEKLEREVTLNLDSIWNTELQNRLNQIEQEKQAWIDKGVAEVKATQWAEQEKANAQKNAAMNVLKNQYEEYKAYQRGGYKGLQEYQFKQLTDAGIDVKDLYMTPTQLLAFQQAKKISENSLLPNFMTRQDKFENALEWRAYSQAQLENFTGTKANLEAFKRYVDSFNPYDPKLQDRIAYRGIEWANYNPEPPIYYDRDTNTLGNIWSYNKEQALAGAMTGTAYATDALLQQPMDNGIIIELTDKLSALTQAVSDGALKQPEQYYSDNNSGNVQRQPINANVTVQIQEAHAWDSSHIQELADKVADVIEPEITSAIDGNANSY